MSLPARRNAPYGRREAFAAAAAANVRRRSTRYGDRMSKQPPNKGGRIDALRGEIQCVRTATEQTKRRHALCDPHRRQVWEEDCGKSPILGPARQTSRQAQNRGLRVAGLNAALGQASFGRCRPPGFVGCRADDVATLRRIAKLKSITVPRNRSTTDSRRLTVRRTFARELATLNDQ